MTTPTRVVVHAVQMGFCEKCGRTMQLDHLLEFHGKHVCFYPCYCELAEAWNDAEREAYYDRFYNVDRGGY